MFLAGARNVLFSVLLFPPFLHMDFLGGGGSVGGGGGGGGGRERGEVRRRGCFVRRRSVLKPHTSPGTGTALVLAGLAVFYLSGGGLWADRE
ncbi:hypothetical protein BZA05DRAFT_412219 [Tricharina praecox]|uniref:uncharacterized protein n=1 Tax=Tricharina praecox TaxID=43433 RepID=UPI002220BBA4|nr:uncharacterized protein BZA05DRAFT_412219 [Tricharina praecox]KAI5842377.1 hypothetical protein BZA05DRAFT_412219 [Tricharina praecox]